MASGSPPQPPSPARISVLLCRLQDSFAWQHQADDYDLSTAWNRERSGSVFYRMTGRPSGQEVIVKIVAGWEPGDAERTFRAMVELAETLDAAQIEGGGAIRPLARADEPP